MDMLESVISSLDSFAPMQARLAEPGKLTPDVACVLNNMTL
jgi:hypothetical protein